jgi:hypothetical protein
MTEEWQETVGMEGYALIVASSGQAKSKLKGEFNRRKNYQKMKTYQ